MAKTSAETTLGEDIHTRTTADAVESQAVVLAIDGSDDVVPANSTYGISVEIKNPNVQAVTAGPSQADDENADAVTVRAGLWANYDGGDTGERLMPIQATEAGELRTKTVLGIDGSDDVVPANATAGLSVLLRRSFDGEPLGSGSAPMVVEQNAAFLVNGDPGNPLPVSDNGGSLTVDGTVTIQDGGGSLTVDGTFWQATQPVSGTVTANLAAGTNNIGDVDVLSLPTLPAGTNNIGDVDVLTLPALPAGNNNIGDVDVASVPAPLSTTGGGAEAAALRVTIADNSTGVLSVDDNGSSLTVDGTVAVSSIAGSLPAGNNVIGQVDINSSVTLPVEVESFTAALPAGDNNIGNVDVLTLPALPAGNNNIGDVDVASVAGTVTTQDVRPSTSAVTSVNDTASSTTLLSSTAGRLAAAIFNDSTEALFVKFGTTASATSFTVKILAGGYFEFPQPVYTGRVDGIWNADASGAARITELTA